MNYTNLMKNETKASFERNSKVRQPVAKLVPTLEFKKLVDRDFESFGDFVNSFEGRVSPATLDCDNCPNINFYYRCQVLLGDLTLFSKLSNPFSEFFVNHAKYKSSLTKSDIKVIFRTGNIFPIYACIMNKFIE